MDGVDGISRRRRRSLKERLGLKNMGCCGATWAFKPNTINSTDSDDEEQQQEQDEGQNAQQLINSGQSGSENEPGSVCAGRNPLITSSGMNLAAALAAEREIRAADGTGGGVGPISSGNANNGRMDPARTAPGTPLRASLMRLLAEADGCDGEEVKAGSDSAACCVCMERKKGAALIPCGHTFCRVCSREIWLNRGSCPLCNRSILEILDIF